MMMMNRIFRKYCNGIWEAVPMSDLKVGDIILAEDVFNCYFKVEQEKQSHEIDPGEFDNAITVDGINLPSDIKPFWMNLNPDAAHVAAIQKEIENNGGQCCCVLKSKQSVNTICPCKAYRETRKCICQLYIEE